MSDLKVTTATNGEASGAAAAKTSAADIAKVLKYICTNTLIISLKVGTSWLWEQLNVQEI